MSDDKLFRNRIVFISFALTILVIWVHAFNMEYNGMLLTGVSIFDPGSPFFLAAVENIFSELLGQTAVPGFFMISAYLFYRNIGGRLTFPVLKRKWGSRIRSLLIPYVLWNLFYYVVYLAAGRAPLPTLKSIFNAVVNYSMNPVFWYMKQLILLTVFAPIIYTALKRMPRGIFFLFLSFFAAVFWNRLPLHIINEDALFYYMLGAFASLHLKHLTEEKSTERNHPEEKGTEGKRAEEKHTEEKHTEGERAEDPGNTPLYVSIALFAAGAAAETIYILLLRMPAALPETMAGFRAEVLTGATVLYRALMPAGLYFLIMYVQNKKRGRETGIEPAARPWMNINFFIYATHFLIIKVCEAFADALPVSADAGKFVLFALFIFMPAICTGAAFFLSELLKKKVPAFWRLINGGR